MQKLKIAVQSVAILCAGMLFRAEAFAQSPNIHKPVLKVESKAAVAPPQAPAVKEQEPAPQSPAPAVPKPQPPQPQAPKPAAVTPQAPKPQVAKLESPKPQPPKLESPKLDGLKPEVVLGGRLIPAVGRREKQDRPKPSAEQQSQLNELVASLESLEPKQSVAPHEKLDLTEDLMAMAREPSRPSQSNVEKLAADLATATCGKELSKVEQTQLANDVAQLMTSPALPQADFERIVQDVKGILAAGGATPAQTQAVAADLKAISQDIKKAAPGPKAAAPPDKPKASKPSKSSKKPKG